jgi:hypothetical protein
MPLLAVQSHHPDGPQSLDVDLVYPVVLGLLARPAVCGASPIAIPSARRVRLLNGTGDVVIDGRTAGLTRDAAQQGLNQQLRNGMGHVQNVIIIPR